MSQLLEAQQGSRHLFMGNEAIARGALEAGVSVAAGYPGTPSSEIIESLAAITAQAGLYVEWSVNEKVALEVASAASFAGLKALAVMKQPGLNVAADYLLHLSASGTRGGMVLVSADDPGALSSVNEAETRPYAKIMEMPLLEPGDFQEALEMTKWAFELSEKIKNVVLMRTVTRLSHASGIVVPGKLPEERPKARFRHDGMMLDPETGAIASGPVFFKHPLQQAKLKQAQALFEDSPFNTYTGPEKPELLIITSSICSLYSREAVNLLGVQDRVGILKLGTTWPLPTKLIEKHLATTDQVLMVEEVLPFLEEEVKIAAAEMAGRVGVKRFFGKRDGLIPSVGEMNPDRVLQALAKVLVIGYVSAEKEYLDRAAEVSVKGSPLRDATFCPGCPHRASFWSVKTALSLDNTDGFVCGDIGCYAMGTRGAGFFTVKTLHSMGSGTGIASGFGKLGSFGFDQRILSVCGDSTFFHSAIPPLVNAVHNASNIMMVVVDNSGTAMTGFQPHPGLTYDAMQQSAAPIDIPAVCRAIGAKVTMADPFDVPQTQKALLDLFDQDGVRVLVLKQACALSPQRKGKKNFEVKVDEKVCVGENCGCNRMCTRIFACPGLTWDAEKNQSRIDEVVCAGCGVCASICPTGAIVKKEVA